MAMVVPESALAANANPHMYRLYIIVFHGRQLNYKATGASGEALYRGIVQGNGRGGGVVDMVLADPSELPVPNDPRTGNRLVQDDYLNAGDWVLLSDHFQYQSTYANWQSNSGGAWRWYQIQRVDPADPNSQNGVIRTTLVGPDWTGQDVDVSTPNVWDVHAIVLSNVLAVYEKTIRIEYESIWND